MVSFTKQDHDNTEELLNMKVQNVLWVIDHVADAASWTVQRT